MGLKAGDRLGPYEIQSLLGAGGMGEVYRGRDTRLGRDVALKVISPARIEDVSLRRRFELEARAASKLNHPSIVTVYDVGETDGTSWIAMEWVDGRTLRQVLGGGALPLRDALKLARQIADGLASAHAGGVVHRDLKPENVMITSEGRAKILDFGLARLTHDDITEGSGSQVETLAVPADATRAGTILGTVGYMSPEQASGRPADFRSDQFALGLITYEMLTGQRAFTRPTAVETLSAIIREDPPSLASLRSGVSQPLQDAVARCLAKRPEDRFASTKDLAARLESVAAEAGEATPPPTIETTARMPAATARGRFARTALAILGIALVLGLAASAWLRFRPAAGPIGSLAVLPFENDGRDPETDYLSDGLTETLINQLSRVASLRVMARATVFRFKGTADPQEAGRQLGVGAVLTGTLARRGNRIAISAELVDIATGARLWGDRYDRPFADLLLLEDTLVSNVASGLRLRMTPAESRALARHGTDNLEAYELYLRGRHLFARDTEEDDLDARLLFQQALEKDERFVEAHLALGGTYMRSASHGWAPPAEAWPHADEALKKALAVDPSNALVRCSLANRHFLFDWDWEGAEREYRELLEDPLVLRGDAFRGIALYFWSRGRPDEAAALMERALRVDPGNLESRSMRADFLSLGGHTDEAIQLYRGIVDDEPAFALSYFGLADALRRKGDVAGAILALRKAYELTEEDAGLAALGGASSAKDYENAEIVVARARLANLRALATRRYVSPLDIGRLEAQVGERDKAFASLDAAFDERSPGLLLLKVDRAWDRVRDDPRFAGLVRHVGIP